MKEMEMMQCNLGSFRIAGGGEREREDGRGNTHMRRDWILSDNYGKKRR